MKMGKSFLFILLVPFLFVEEEEKPLFEFVSIKYPKQILISKDWNEKGIDCKIEIYFRYNGEDIKVPPAIMGINYISSKTIRTKGRAYFYTKNGKILLKASHWFSDTLAYKGWVGESPFIFTKNTVYSEEIDIFSYSLLKETELEKAILERKLLKIIIQIYKCEINWGIDGKENESQLKIGKTIEIKVKYEK